MRRLAVAAALALAGCGVAPEPQAVVAAVAPDVPSYVAGRGDVMVFAPGEAVEAADPGWTALRFVGMRSPGEAVFARERLAALPGGTRATDVPGVYVPVATRRPDDEGPFVGPGVGEGAEEIVLRPALGSVFGVGDVMLLVTEISPGRVTFQLDSLDLLGAL